MIRMEGEEKERKVGHWTQLLVDQLMKEKKAPFVISGGATASGLPHLGTVCEFLYPSVVKNVLEDRGEKADFYFVSDILDAFDNIPADMQKYGDRLAGELGKPLLYVKDPAGEYSSIGERYLQEVVKLVKFFSVDIKLVRANELYESGKVDPYTRIFLDNEQKTKEVVAVTSLRKVEDLKDWSPIMPICERCGKIATTRVLSHSGDEYEYACDKDTKYTKGCGFKGKAKITDHRYKLQWRLHWPTWQAIFNSSIEGSGMDHMTRGGSGTTAPAIHKEILDREPPILFKYGFVLFQGRKPSKSKGTGPSAVEISTLMPPEILRYAFVEPNLEQNKDIDPTGDKLIDLYNEVERLSTLKAPENRADEKSLIAFNVSIKRLKWRAHFVDVLLNYQIYKDWEKVGRLLNDPEGARYLAPYIEEWLRKGYAPERYNFAVKPTRITELQKAVLKFASSLKEGMDEVTVHNLVYETAKADGAEPMRLFAQIYTALIGKDKGPRLGKLITSIGIQKSREILEGSAS